MIRRVTEADASRIAEIYNHYVLQTSISFETETVTGDEMLRRIRVLSSEFPYFVYEADGVVEGYCYVHRWKERAAYRNTLETTVYMAHGCEHRGWGRELMQKLIDECRMMGYHSLIACITADNEPSIRFHRRLGFTQVSHYREVGRKFNRWLDVCDYQLLL